MSLSTRGKKLLAAQQLERARALRWYLNRNGHLVDGDPTAETLRVFQDWLRREWRLGYRTGKTSVPADAMKIGK